jgi:hypothetical protein
MSCEIPLTRGYVALVDDEDFERASSLKWYAHVGSNRPGGPGHVYAMRIDPSSRGAILLHRFVLRAKAPYVDHINTDTLDCRKCNLREVTARENAWNSSIPRMHKTSRFKGVSWNKNANKWSAFITKDGDRKHLGYFMDERDAAATYNAAAIERFGEFAKLNNLEAENG